MQGKAQKNPEEPGFLRKRRNEKRLLPKQQPPSSLRLFGDSAHGASTGASTAAHAGVLIDLVLTAGVLDSANGASTGAGTAADASIRNFVCHFKSTSCLNLPPILSEKIKNATVISRNNQGNNRMFFGKDTNGGDSMKKKQQKPEDMQPADNRLTMSTQHEDRFTPPQVKA